MQELDSREAAGNKHVITTSARVAPYHSVIADLVGEYAPTNGRVLDIGCGMGQLERLVAARRPDLEFTVADAYDVCLDSCRTLPHVQSAIRVDESRFNIDEVITQTYDIVVMSHVLEHILDPVGGLRKAMNCVTMGGVCIVAVPNPTRPDILITNLFRKHYVNRGHVVSWDPSHWRNFLEHIMSLKVERHLSDYLVFPGAFSPGPLRSLSMTMAKAVPWWGRSNISVIRKSATAVAGSVASWDTKGNCNAA